jgi:hypothetical protein
LDTIVVSQEFVLSVWAGILVNQRGNSARNYVIVNTAAMTAIGRIDDFCHSGIWILY